MRKLRKKRGLACCMTGVMLLGLLAGPADLTLKAEAATKKYVKSLSISKKVKVQEGKQVTLKPIVKVVKKASKQLTVKSSNKKIAKVSYSKKKGSITITGVKPGKATITVTTKAENRKGKKLVKRLLLQ